MNDLIVIRLPCRLPSKALYIVMKANCKVVNITCFNIGRFYARDVKDVETHLTSEMLTFTGENGEKTGSIKVDDNGIKKHVVL